MLPFNLNLSPSGHVCLCLQITEQMERLLQEKLQPYKMEIAKSAAEAVVMVTHFETSIHTPAMVVNKFHYLCRSFSFSVFVTWCPSPSHATYQALVRCAEDVIHTLAEILPCDAHSKEHWVLDLERLKEKLHSTVHFTLQTLRAVFHYHQYYNKASALL